MPDRLFKKHGRWKLEAAKNGHVEDSSVARMDVSKSLDLNSILSNPMYVETKDSGVHSRPSSNDVIVCKWGCKGSTHVRGMFREIYFSVV